MAKSYFKSEFHMLMEKVEAVDARVKNYLELASYDKELPIYDFLEEVRLMFGRWNCENRQQALYTFTDLIGKFQEILQQNEAECTLLDNKNFKKRPYYSDLYKPKIVLRIYDLPIYPLPHKDDWVIPKEIMDEIVLPPKYKRPPGRPPKKDRGKSERDMFGKKSKNCCSSCGLKGHNRRSCRKYNKR
ncbi:uncharacterized protein LOC107855754 [Capsicum annuum]|uniref:uncharacterized protein LOC107855754 n=1 Tax=Capsicum annuum TaxID=4072 RepID=UPI001FB0743B|nr:uncharacterized protein LOC107855754 [Capsicum annuum]